MDYKAKTLEELAQKSSRVTGKQALVGFDGFVDKIMDAVDQRQGPGTAYTPIDTISEFGERISAAAGKSANIELYQKREKLGGNGPIMANALLGQGLAVRYIGALGKPEVLPVFQEFKAKTEAVSICEPGVTNAVEFDDGKIMMGTTSSLEEMTYSNIISIMGEGAFFDAVSRADLMAMVNWTMIPNMNAIWNALLEKVLPNLGPRDGGRFFFFDLADPEKRSDGDVKAALSTIRRFISQGAVTLGLNLKEAERVSAVLGHKPVEADAEGLKTMAKRIRQELEITMVVVHPTKSAACATKNEAWHVEGYFVEKPVISTGAGDHFNAGFTTGQLLGLSPPACLTLAVCTSGYYVSTGNSPSLYQIDSFLRNWK